MILLTDEETRNVEMDTVQDSISGNPLGDIYKGIAKAQLKKVAEWGKEDCPHIHKIFINIKLKHECSVCWQDLLKELE